MHTFKLPQEIADMVHARNKLRSYYRQALSERGCTTELKFTLDGNLVGDMGEALAVQRFGITLAETAAMEGIDGFTPDGNTVQVKATGTGRGPAFPQTETRADYLVFFELDFENAKGAVVFNGPEHYAVQKFPKVFNGQRMLSKNQIRHANSLVPDNERLIISGQT
ncbi:DUF6998 domain-containing protein [Phyllobacterium ifriqiyense]|uniref:DUF6998 domain-containing protein n=1 Tax=Phyllobacterium ifriqiyense TaxID=314238 RepID=UPI00339506E7